MRALRSRRAEAPGPSRLSYRLKRLWAQGWVRGLVRVYLPLAAVAAGAWWVVSSDRMRVAIRTEIAAFVERVAERPEFTVKGVEIEGGSEGLAAAVRRSLGPVEGASSLRLDLDSLRGEIGAMGAVASASVYFDPTGRLVVRLAERVPAALWRDPEGALWLLDRTGIVIAGAGGRADHPRLPLLIGIGAPRKVPEALGLLAAAPDLAPRVRALSRVGERRWDLVLDRDMIVRLPEGAPGRALKGAMGLHFGEELFDRDLVVIDLRLPDRPALRLAPRAAEAMVLRRAVDLVAGEDT